MQSPKEASPSRSERATWSSQYVAKDYSLKSFDARIEKRDPFQSRSISLVGRPRAANGQSRKTSVPHGARVLSNRCWRPGDVPLLPLDWRVSKARASRLFAPQPNGRLLRGSAIQGTFIQVARVAPTRPITPGATPLWIQRA